MIHTCVFKLLSWYLKWLFVCPYLNIFPDLSNQPSERKSEIGPRWSYWTRSGIPSLHGTAVQGRTVDHDRTRNSENEFGEYRAPFEVIGRSRFTTVSFHGPASSSE